jgi:hypothetical protein
MDMNLSGEGSPVVLTATGADFVPGAKLYLDNVPIETTVISSTSLSAVINSTFFQAGGTIQVSVRNPDPSLGPSGSLPLAINNPLPVIASIEPASLAFNPGVPATVTIVGQNFAPNSVFELTPPCVSVFVTNRISAQITEMKIHLQCAGTYSVRVLTPAPGGGNSETLTFTVN